LNSCKDSFPFFKKSFDILKVLSKHKKSIIHLNEKCPYTMVRTSSIIIMNMTLQKTSINLMTEGRETNYTLKRKCITSPSLTIYSFPSRRTFPASLAATMFPAAKRSSYATVSARIKPFSKSE
jgi:hypothetical protein